MAELIVIWGLGLTCIYFAYLADKQKRRANILRTCCDVLKTRSKANEELIFEYVYWMRLRCEDDVLHEQATMEHAALIELLFRLGINDKYREYISDKYPDAFSRLAD